MNQTNGYWNKGITALWNYQNQPNELGMGQSIQKGYLWDVYGLLVNQICCKKSQLLYWGIL